VTETGDAAGPLRRRLLTRDERQAAIIHGAAVAFARSGFAGTSMEDVATASGITKLIVYRNFASKEALYRAVLQAVSERLILVFEEEIAAGRRPAGVRSLLQVAREEPDGFVLLWVHAAREAQFADYAAGHRTLAVKVARRRLMAQVTDPAILDWAADAWVDWCVESVLSWLRHGDPARDTEFIRLAQDSLAALIGVWQRASQED
jgi:AcrR family transcriptional regulator